MLVARIDGGPMGLFGNDIAEQLDALVDRADQDPAVQAVVFTGTHPERFVSHAEVRWLQEGGATVPSVGVRGASALAHTARGVNRAGGLKAALGKTPLWPAVQLERVHQTFLKMNRSGVMFIAALNGSALGLGAEFCWANDLRVMADGDYVIGQPEVLLGIMPGGGGSQRLPRLIGNHRALVAILFGRAIHARPSARGRRRGRRRGTPTRCSIGRSSSPSTSAPDRRLRSGSDQALGLLRRLGGPGEGPAHRALGVPRHRALRHRPGADARLHGQHRGRAASCRSTSPESIDRSTGSRHDPWRSAPRRKAAQQ